VPWLQLSTVSKIVLVESKLHGDATPFPTLVTGSYSTCTVKILKLIKFTILYLQIYLKICLKLWFPLLFSVKYVPELLNLHQKCFNFVCVQPEPTGALAVPIIVAAGILKAAAIKGKI
jgi:hypothetical protein